MSGGWCNCNAEFGGPDQYTCCGYDSCEEPTTPNWTTEDPVPVGVVDCWNYDSNESGCNSYNAHCEWEYGSGLCNCAADLGGPDKYTCCNGNCDTTVPTYTTEEPTTEYVAPVGVVDCYDFDSSQSNCEANSSHCTWSTTHSLCNCSAELGGPSEYKCCNGDCTTTEGPTTERTTHVPSTAAETTTHDPCHHHHSKKECRHDWGCAFDHGPKLCVSNDEVSGCHNLKWKDCFQFDHCHWWNDVEVCTDVTACGPYERRG